MRPSFLRPTNTPDIIDVGATCCCRQGSLELTSDCLCQIPTPCCQKYFVRASLMWEVSLHCFLPTSQIFVAKCRKEYSIETRISTPKVGKGPHSRKHRLGLTTEQYGDDKRRKNAFKHAGDQGEPLLKYPCVWKETLAVITLTRLRVLRYQRASQPKNQRRVSVPPSPFPGSGP